METREKAPQNSLMEYERFGVRDLDNGSKLKRETNRATTPADDRAYPSRRDALTQRLYMVAAYGVTLV